jgi:hypothetical protein
MRLPSVAAKKPYEAPAIIHTERVEARAVTCIKAPSQCNPGPAQS